VKTPPLHAGYCTGCDKPVWARAWAQREEPSQRIKAGQEFILWPRPDSVYAVLETSTGEAPGIAFCPECAPALGTPDIVEGLGPVMRLEGAKDRYVDWFAANRELFLRTWLKDALNYEPGFIEFVMDNWHQDRRDG
jgi:hypothetical protein